MPVTTCQSPLRENSGLTWFVVVAGYAVSRKKGLQHEQKNTTEDVARNTRELFLEEYAETMTVADAVIIITDPGCKASLAAAILIAEVAKECGSLILVFAHFPFAFEGKTRTKLATAGMQWLEKITDTTIVISSNQLIGHTQKVIEILGLAVQSSVSLVTIPSLIGTDFADFKLIFTGGGLAKFYFGEGKGNDRLEEAQREALDNPIVDSYSLKSAKSLLIMTLGREINISELSKLDGLLNNRINPDANVIYGYSGCDKMEDGLLKAAIIAKS